MKWGRMKRAGGTTRLVAVASVLAGSTVLWGSAAGAAPDGSAKPLVQSAAVAAHHIALSTASPAELRSLGVPAKGSYGFLLKLGTAATAHAYDANLARGRTAARVAAVNQLATVHAAQRRVIAALPSASHVLYRDARRARGCRRLHEGREPRSAAAHRRRDGRVPDRAEDSVALLLDAARARAAGLVGRRAGRPGREHHDGDHRHRRRLHARRPRRPRDDSGLPGGARRRHRRSHLSRPGQDPRRLRLRRRRVRRRRPEPHDARARPQPARLRRPRHPRRGHRGRLRRERGRRLDVHRRLRDPADRLRRRTRTCSASGRGWLRRRSSTPTRSSAARGAPTSSPPRSTRPRTRTATATRPTTWT